MSDEQLADNHDINVSPNVDGAKADLNTAEPTETQQKKDEESVKKYDEHQQKADQASQGDNKESEESKEESKEPEESKESKEESKEPEEQDDSLQPFFDEYAEKGELSEDSYQKLSDRGIPRKMVDEYIQNKQAVADTITHAGYQAVGGEETFNAMAKWAKASLPEADLTEYNNAVGSGDINKALEAVNNLKSKYENANGQEPSLVGQTTSTAANQQLQGYKSMNQLTEAMRDPRYRNDPAYRAEVQSRLKYSKLQ